MPNPRLEILPIFSQREALCSRDSTVRHILSMRFWSCAGAVDESTCTDFGWSGEYSEEEANDESVAEFAMEFAMTKAG
jgi:hypothetical protein